MDMRADQPVASETGAPTAEAEKTEFVKEGEELFLSGQDMTELLNAVTGRGLPFRFTAKGRSMYPFIRDSDVVTVAPYASHRPRVGDVVAFARPGSRKLIVHRVIGREQTGLWIKGDSCTHAEGPIPLDHILGTVTCVERGGRQILLGLGHERVLIPWLVSHPRLFSMLRTAWRSVKRIAGRSE